MAWVAASRRLGSPLLVAIFGRLGVAGGFAVAGMLAATLRLFPGCTRTDRSTVTSRPESESGSSAPGASSATRGTETLSPFASRAQCETLLKAGKRAPRKQGTVRIGTWNIRWFPDGVPDNTTSSYLSTDLGWLACAIAWLDVDALALAEIKPASRSQSALDQVIYQLDAVTGGSYKVRLDDCPESSGQHVGWLVDTGRLTVHGYVTHGALNPYGDACAHRLRPGLGVGLRSVGGLDFHAVAVHLKSGVLESDLALRRRSLLALDGLLREIVEDTKDADVVIAGDFNSMGCRSCEKMAGSAAEASWMDGRLKAFFYPARRVSTDLGCSYYYQGQPALLDHFVVTQTMAEAPVRERASVEGYCHEARCEATGSEPGAASLHLSDHCPMVLSLVDRDLD